MLTQAAFQAAYSFVNKFSCCLWWQTGFSFAETRVARFQAALPHICSRENSSSNTTPMLVAASIVPVITNAVP
ncbi:MAG: hypothetical protein ACFNLD_02945, partial [Kingella oralis]